MSVMMRAIMGEPIKQMFIHPRKVQAWTVKKEICDLANLIWRFVIFERF